MYGEAMQRKYLRTKASEKDERQKGFLWIFMELFEEVDWGVELGMSELKISFYFNEAFERFESFKKLFMEIKKVLKS
jgi:hypothetical protein